MVVPLHRSALYAAPHYSITVAIISAVTRTSWITSASYDLLYQLGRAASDGRASRDRLRGPGVSVATVQVGTSFERVFLLPFILVFCYYFLI